MKKITFFDTEIEVSNKKILDIGAITNDGNIYHLNSKIDFYNFINKSEFVCGHNIFNHDLKYLQTAPHILNFDKFQIIDTLLWSPLLFPTKQYHKLVKIDKLKSEEPNNPVSDSIKAKELFYDEINAFNKLNEELKNIFYSLLKEEKEFNSFFAYISFKPYIKYELKNSILKYFYKKICSNSPLENIIEKRPIELAYALALINSNDRYSIIPPWVLKNYPDVGRVIYLLRDKPCLRGCEYCNDALNANKGLKDFFGFDSFRSYGEKPLQKDAVNAAIKNKSLLAIFPTGGGKSITFQVPALMSGRNSKGLTIVISPLQSLMKDQVENLEKKGITEAVTINGLLDPIERAKSIQRIEEGTASILYISPESLRSKTIEHLLLGRNVTRFVIDEAHCFSSWGHDFRVDYLYIGDFIKSLQEKKNLAENIPVSCFTATAKQNVIEDIRNYFNKKLSINLELFTTNITRTNLKYKVLKSNSDDEKYNRVIELIESKQCPTIIYVSTTYNVDKLAKKLTQNEFNARPYHGKMDKKEKSNNQNDFISGEVQIMVATSAFGMGVDKKNVGMVIHYDISNSLENYIQEAGRAGRDNNIIADCYILFNEDDLYKHFVLLNQTKISAKEINQIWIAIKALTKFGSVSNSALEIARKAGWDDCVSDIETRVKTAIAALEYSKYLKRGQNVPKIYANSIRTKNAQEAIRIINNSLIFNKKQKEYAVRIISKLFSSKSRLHSNDEIAETRVDYISDHLGIVKKEVIKIITLLREEKILTDQKDLSAFIKQSDNENRSLSIVKNFSKIEDFLFPLIKEEKRVFNLKELNETAIVGGNKRITPKKIKTILNFWAIKKWIEKEEQNYSKNHITLMCKQPHELLNKKLRKRHEISEFIIEYLFKKRQKEQNTNQESKQIRVEFSVHELKENYEKKKQLFISNISINDIEDSLFYLSRIDAMKIEGGFLVVYNKLTIDRIEKDNKIQYKKSDYQYLDKFYKSKIEQIHIAGEYAKIMLEDYEKALTFVNDYFHLNYSAFLNKYFPSNNERKYIKKPITRSKFEDLFGSLSPTQEQIILDNRTKNIVVAAGPGSGKTRILVHKIASLLIMEDVKYEQLLMLTFSRASTTEFKKRLIDLIGNNANYVEIKTFHSFCFDLLGRIGDIEKSKNIIQNATEKIISGDVEINKITKTVLVLDEAQDMNSDEFNLVKSLMDKNEEMRVVVVGDDDQNIYTFRKADSKFFKQFLQKNSSKKYELIENFRSQKNLVEFTNQFVEKIENRFKSKSILPVQKENGKVKIFHYKSKNLIEPLVSNIISSELSGTTGVLTYENEHASLIANLLFQNDFAAKLIQSPKKHFNLINLIEIRTFIDNLKIDEINKKISIDKWNTANREFIQKHKNSSNFELCKTIIKDFQKIYPKEKYKSDFEEFISESKLENFTLVNKETIFVSTIHKAKGKEFDNVFLMLDGFDISSDENKRILYVAMTRAKQNLIIHSNENYFDNIIVDNMEHIYNSNIYSEPKQLICHLSHEDVNLGYFDYVQHRINLLKSGDDLLVENEGLSNSKGETVLKFSKNFLSNKLYYEKKGFNLRKANINFILYWDKKDKENNKNEIKIILPELYFER